MDKFKEIKRILIVILFFNWLVAFSKLIYGFITKSAAMTADGVHSFADGASNIIGLVGIWAASKPVDEDHPYGHKKYETVATLGISVMLFLASFDIIKDSFLRLFHPVVPHVNIFSFGLMIIGFLINVVVMTYERKKGIELSSDVLVCDSIHTKSDMFVSSAVIVTLISTKLGFPVLDTLVAFIIGILIAKAGFEILKKSNEVWDNIYKRKDTNFQEFLKTDDIVLIEKTSIQQNGRIEHGIFIFLKMNRNKDTSWSFLCPTENQINILSNLESLYGEFEKNNGR